MLPGARGAGARPRGETPVDGPGTRPYPRRDGFEKAGRFPALAGPKTPPGILARSA